MRLLTHERDIWMSHVSHMTETYEWVMSHTWPRHMNESCLTHDRDMWMSHVSHKTHVNTRQVYVCHTYEWVTPCIRMGHVTHMSESCKIYERVKHIHKSCHAYNCIMLHIQISHVTHTHEMSHTWPRRMTWMSHARHMNESNTSIGFVTHAKIIRGIFVGGGSGCKDSRAKYCHAYELVTSHKSIRHVTYMNELCFTQNYLKRESKRWRWMEGFSRQISLSHTYEWVMSHTWMSHIYKRVMSPTWLFARGESGWKDSCAKYCWGRGIYEWVISQIWMSHVSYRIIRIRWRWMQRFSRQILWRVRSTSLLRIARLQWILLTCVWNDSSIHGIWLIRNCGMTRAYVPRVSLLPKVSVCERTPSYVWYDSFVYDSFVCGVWLVHMYNTNDIQYELYTIRIIYNTKFPHRIFLTNSS